MPPSLAGDVKLVLGTIKWFSLSLLIPVIILFISEWAYGDLVTIWLNFRMIHSTDKNIDSKVDHKPAFYLAKTGATRYYLSVPKLLALQFVYMLWMLKLKKKMLLLVFTLLSYLIFLVYMYFTSMLNKVVVYKILESRSMLHLTGRPGHPSNRSYSLQIFFFIFVQQ